jgi:hypothetical protein
VKEPDPEVPLSGEIQGQLLMILWLLIAQCSPLVWHYAPGAHSLLQIHGGSLQIDDRVILTGTEYNNFIYLTT